MKKFTSARRKSLKLNRKIPKETKIPIKLVSLEKPITNVEDAVRYSKRLKRLKIHLTIERKYFESELLEVNQQDFERKFTILSAISRIDNRIKILDRAEKVFIDPKIFKDENFFIKVYKSIQHKLFTYDYKIRKFIKEKFQELQSLWEKIVNPKTDSQIMFSRMLSILGIALIWNFIKAKIF